DEALTDAERAIQLDPTDPKAYNNRGTAYIRLDRLNDALMDFQQATELDPNYAIAYLNIGSIYYHQEMVEQAIPYFEKAAHLGLQQGAQLAEEARRSLELETSSEEELIQQAFASFQQAHSVETMRQAIERFPLMTDTDFIDIVEQIIAQQVMPENRPAFEQ